jgi:hypothetical protein
VPNAMRPTAAATIASDSATFRHTLFRTTGRHAAVSGDRE